MKALKKIDLWLCRNTSAIPGMWYCTGIVVYGIVALFSNCKDDSKTFTADAKGIGEAIAGPALIFLLYFLVGPILYAIFSDRASKKGIVQNDDETISRSPKKSTPNE
jgi:hypothetical protein